MHTISKIMWLRENKPDVFRRVRKFLCYEEYVFHLLGIEAVTDHSIAARTMAFDVKSTRWSEKMLSIAGLDESLFPSVAPSGTAIGEVASSVAEELGLPKGVVAVTGGHDQPCNALGAGIIRSGTAVYGTGTVECITPAIPWPDDVEEMLKGNLACYPHVVEGLYTSVAFNFTGGALLKWYRDTFADREKEIAASRGVDPYDVILEQLPQGPASPMILPHFTSTGTPYFDTRSKGAILGLTLGTRKQEIVKAILEGVTFEMKVNLEVLKHAGVPVSSMRATGGGAKSAAWVQLKADIMGIPIASLQVSEATSLGTAILAGTAIGVYPSVEAAVGELVKVKGVFEPNPQKQGVYEERFETYKRIYPAIREISYAL
jgi:xylulokinase